MNQHGHPGRRWFLRLLAGAGVATVLPPIWFPLAPHGARAPGDAILPAGLGLGINLDEPGQGEGMLDTALEVFDPAWYYTWWRDPVRNRPGWLPMIWTHGWNGTPAYPVDAAEFSRYIRTLRQAGIDPGRLVWMLANEPEFSGWTPEESVQAVLAQVYVMRECGIEPTVLAPGSGIKDPHFDYLRRWCDAAQRAGLAFTLAIHIYDWRPWRLDQLWQRFCQWFDSTGLGQVLVTECGAGENRSMSEWLAVMPWFYRLLDDSRVRALAPFSAYPTDRFGPAFPGFMDADGNRNELGQQWIAERDRRN